MNMDQLPPRCLELCPVVNQSGVDEYPLSFTRNCKGPEPSDGNISRKVQLHRDGTAVVIEPRSLTIEHADGTAKEVIFVESAAGELVCRNSGIERSINTLIASTGE